MRNIATAPSNYLIPCGHPHRYRTIDVVVQDLTAGGDRRSRSMFDFTRFDDGDIAEQAAVVQ